MWGIEKVEWKTGTVGDGDDIGKIKEDRGVTQGQRTGGMSNWYKRRMGEMQEWRENVGDAEIKMVNGKQARDVAEEIAWIWLRVIT